MVVAQADKDFFIEILNNIGAPITKENLKFLAAWRHSAKPRPPITTHNQSEYSTITICTDSARSTDTARSTACYHTYTAIYYTTMLLDA